MAEESEKYVLLLHHNPDVKTLAEFMDRQHIYDTDEQGKVVSDERSVDMLFDYNKDFIWEQMTEQDKKKVKTENGTYPTSSSDLTKNNTLPCPCKIKVKSKNITAELAIAATNLQENSSDVYAFENEKIQELYQDEGFTIPETSKRSLSPTVFGWFKSLYYMLSLDDNSGGWTMKNDITEFANLSKHVLSLSTNVGINGGNFSLRLPVIGAEAFAQFFNISDGDFSHSEMKTNNAVKNEFKYNNNREFYAKKNIDENIENNFYSWLISPNDLIFLSFEKLDMEMKEDDFLFNDEDNFSVESEISKGVFDMIGLVDTVTINTDPSTGNAVIDVSGRDLMKLLIEDGSWFFNSSTTTEPSYIFQNEPEANNNGDYRNVNMLNGKYVEKLAVDRMRRWGEIDIFANRINMSISYIIKGLLSQLSNIEVVPSVVFKSWGDDRTTYTDLKPEEK